MVLYWHFVTVNKMQVYLVGGAVRDQLLGIKNSKTDRDFVVVGASVKQMLALGYRQVGKDFPVFLHPETHEEYALARLERKIGKGYQGFRFDVAKTVTLKQDLSRRDLTINAIAKDQNGQIIDPFDGQKDLNNGLLKHISAAFVEDPVRVLRVAVFAARFSEYGFKVAHQTHHLMQQMVASGEVDALIPERIFQELNKALSYKTPSSFFKVLAACGAYSKIFCLPKLTTNSHQNSFKFLDNLQTDNTTIKFAIWLHSKHTEDINRLCNLLKCPKKYKKLATLSAQWFEFAKTFQQQNTQQIFDFFSSTDAIRQKQRFTNLLTVFNCLNVDITQIVSLKNQLDKIDTSHLDQTNIATALSQQKQKIIQQFLKK